MQQLLQNGEFGAIAVFLPIQPVTYQAVAQPLLPALLACDLQSIPDIIWREHKGRLAFLDIGIALLAPVVPRGIPNGEAAIIVRIDDQSRIERSACTPSP